jgi:hypothetical protein
MKVKWKKLLVTSSTWLVLEIALNILGLDNLADYSEFIFNRSDTIITLTQNLPYI